MDNEEHIRTIISIKQKRLMILNQQAAIRGINTEPHILMEIDTINKDLENLTSELNKSQNTEKNVEISSRNKIKILFMAANPVGEVQLRTGEEVRQIDEKLRKSELRDRFELIHEHAVRTKDISELLLRYQPHIVHFSGHGSENGALYFEDSQGNPKVVTPETLLRIFKTLKDNIKCVILNACWSEVQAKTIVEKIDLVIGMHKPVSDKAAILFSEGFYMGIGFGRDIQTAFELGCNEIDVESLDEYYTPKILTNSNIDPKNYYIK